MKRAQNYAIATFLLVALLGCGGKEPWELPPPDVAAPPADAVTTKSGLASKVISPGTGKEHPKRKAKVLVNYTGWTTDGEMFDSSKKTGGPRKFNLDDVIPGWKEGVRLMVKGEKRRLWIPGHLAYANNPTMPQGMLVFDIELVKIISQK